MVVRMTLLARLCAAKFGRFCLEQPASSLMKHTDRMQALARIPVELFNGPFTTAKTYMAAFGKGTAKPTEIYGAGLWVTKLCRPLPKNFVADRSLAMVTTKPGGGKKAVNGMATNLKASQAYTAEFGRAVCAAFYETLPSAEQAMEDADCDTDEDTEDEWADAGCDTVLQTLVRQHRASAVRP